MLERLVQYDWPGNVRELRNVLERAVILSGEGPITLAHLPQGFALNASRPATEEPQVEAGKLTLNLGTSLHDAEKALILSTLEYLNNNRRRTAEVLGLSLKTIQIKLKEYREESSGGQAAAAGGE